MLQTGGILALASGVYWSQSVFYSSLLALLALCAVFCAAGPSRRTLLASFSLLLLFAAGYLSLNRPPPSPLPLHEEKRFYGTVAKDPRMVTGGATVEVDLRGFAEPEPAGGWTPLSGRVLLSMRGETERPPSPGETVFFRAELRPPETFRNPGSEWRPFYFRRAGIAARASAEYPGEVFFASPEGWGAALAARKALGDAIGKTLPGEEGAVLRALTLGDWSRVSPPVLSEFRRCGTTHLLSVSGFHLGVVALGAMALAGFLWSRTPALALRFPAPLAARLLVFPLLIAYTLLTGSQVATLRALAMVLIVLAGNLLCRRVSPYSSLASAVLFLGLCDPGMLFDPGLHLSVAALAGLFWLAPELREIFSGKKEEEGVEKLLPKSRAAKAWDFFSRKGRDLLIVSGSATLATMPLGAYYFGGASWMGLLANPAGVPIAGALALPLGILGVFLFPLWEWGANLAWQGAGASISLLLRLQGYLAPLSSEITGPFTTFLPVAGAWLLLFSFVLFRREGSSGRKRLAAASLGALLLTGPPLVSAAGELLDQNGHIWMIEAGQGQSVILRLPRKGLNPPLWVVADGGGFPASTFDVGENIVLPALRALGCAWPRIVVSTHPHPDHVLGLTAVVREGKPEYLWLPASFEGDFRYSPLLAAAGDAGTKIVWVGPEGYSLEDGGVSLSAYSGAGPQENDRSIALVASAGGAAVLIPGDVEEEGQSSLLKQGLRGPFAFASAPHHGSANAVNESFFSSVAAGFYLVAAGKGESLPSKKFCETVDKLGGEYLITGKEGALHGVFGRSAPIIVEGVR
jgi:competence protein ComEC